MSIQKILIDKYIILFLILSFFCMKNYLLLYSKYYVLNKGKKFINKCLEATSLKRKLNINFNIPKVSVIIPVFNCENTIKYSISSIQNQKLEEIEIILVNDFSKDNSRYIIEEMQKEDPRIVIINNNQNFGTLYSRNIGAIYASGKYIFCLDNDDMILNEEIISKLYNLETKYNYDIIGFKIINANNYRADITNMYDDPFIIRKHNQIIYQPHLKYLSITNNDCHVWGKIIKNEIYKKAISLLGLKRRTTYLCNAEDDVIVLMLFKVAKSFRFIPMYGLFHLISGKTAAFTLPKDHIVFSKLFFLDLLFDISENNYQEKKYVVNNAILIKNFFLAKNLTFNKKNNKYFKKIYKKIFNCPYISLENKAYLKNIFNKI